MREYIDREKAMANIKAAYCCGCNNYNGVKCRACQTMDAMDVLEDEPAVAVIDANALKNDLTDWRDVLTRGSCFDLSCAIDAAKTIHVLDSVLDRIDYLLKENQEEQKDD